MVAANSLQNRTYWIILSQWGSSGEILRGETGSREITVRGERLLWLRGRRKPRTFLSSSKLILRPIWVPQRFPILFPGELETEEWAAAFLTVESVPSVLDTSVGNEMLTQWSWWYYAKTILPIRLFGPRIPQVTRKQIHNLYCNYFWVIEPHGFCHIVYAKAMDEWWWSWSVKEMEHLPPQIGSSPVIYEVSSDPPC